MTSPSNASRRNGGLSRGPVSETGKAVAVWNAAAA
jgi:hypothetical protein